MSDYPMSTNQITNILTVIEENKQNMSDNTYMQIMETLGVIANSSITTSRHYKLNILTIENIFPSPIDFHQIDGDERQNILNQISLVVDHKYSTETISIVTGNKDEQRILDNLILDRVKCHSINSYRERNKVGSILAFHTNNCKYLNIDSHIYSPPQVMDDEDITIQYKKYLFFLVGIECCNIN